MEKINYTFEELLTLYKWSWKNKLRMRVEWKKNEKNEKNGKNRKSCVPYPKAVKRVSNPLFLSFPLSLLPILYSELLK